MFIFLSKLFLAELFFALQKIIKPATEIKNNKKNNLFYRRRPGVALALASPGPTPPLYPSVVIFVIYRSKNFV